VCVSVCVLIIRVHIHAQVQVQTHMYTHMFTSYVHIYTYVYIRIPDTAMLKMVGEAEEIPTVAFSLLSQVLRRYLSRTSVYTCVCVVWAFI